MRMGSSSSSERTMGWRALWVGGHVWQLMAAGGSSRQQMTADGGGRWRQMAAADGGRQPPAERRAPAEPLSFLTEER